FEVYLPGELLSTADATPGRLDEWCDDFVEGVDVIIIEDGAPWRIDLLFFRLLYGYFGLRGKGWSTFVPCIHCRGDELPPKRCCVRHHHELASLYKTTVDSST